MPPLIDVSDAITSPMLADQFKVIRRTQTMGNNGRASFTNAAPVNACGTVYPSNANDLKRFPDLQFVGKTITVITRFALRSASEITGTDYAPDLVQWHGDNFIVAALEDWSSYGPGFVFAICESADLKDVPPTTE